MKIRDRLLSGLLAFALCFGMISPAALAAEAEDSQSPAGLEDALDQEQAPELDEESDSAVEPEPTENEDPPAETPPAEAEEGPEDDENFQDELEDEINEFELYAGEVELTANLVGVDALASAKDVGRVRLDTTGKNVVVDSITYAVAEADEDKVTIDEETGEIKWADGYTPAEDETVTVTVNYTYYSGDDVKYVENFDDKSAKPFTNTNYAINDGQSRTGQYGVTPYGKTPNSPTTAAVGPFENVRVTAWYYDPFTAEEQSCTNTMKFGFAATHDAGTPNTNQLGVFFGTGSGDGTKTNYAYRIVTSGNFSASTQVRSAGWHKLEWVVTNENGTLMYIDDVQVATEANRKQVVNLTLATNWVAQNANDQAGMDLLRNHHYIDDVSIVDMSAQTQSGTTEVEVALKAPEPPEPPALTFGNGGEDEALTKGSTGRVYLDNIEDYVIADVTYTTNNENVLVDKGGNLTVKEGYVPKDGETVKVTAVVTLIPQVSMPILQRTPYLAAMRRRLRVVQLGTPQRN